MEDSADVRLCVDLEPEDMGHGSSGEDVRQFFAGTSLEHQLPVDGGSLYVVDGLPDCERVAALIADYYLAYRFATDRTEGLLGGYAFMKDKRYLFGADRLFSLAGEWERAFDRLSRSCVQDVHLDDQVCKMIIEHEYVNILYLAMRWQCALSEAVILFKKARRMKARFVSAFMERVMQVHDPETAGLIRQNCFGKE